MTTMENGTVEKRTLKDHINTNMMTLRKNTGKFATTMKKKGNFASKKIARAMKLKKAGDIDIDNISSMKKITKDVDIRPDPSSATGFTEFPEKFKAILKASGITLDELKGHENIVYQIVRDHVEGELETFNEPKRRMMTRMSLKLVKEKAATIKDENPLKIFHVNFNKDRIGSGGFGEVYKCVRRSDNQSFAMKTAVVKNKRSIENEIQMHALCSDHANIVAYVDSYLYKNKIYMIVELMTAGSLTDYILDLPRRAQWKEKAIVFVVREMLKGLAFMHSNNHLHRDIKSDNVLLSAKGEVKLADFGFAVGLTREDNTRTSVLGTPFWMAPEVIAKETYDEKVDVWSTGITVIEIADSQPPYMGLQPLKATFLIRTNPSPTFKHPTSWSDELNHLLKVSLVKDPKKRATTEELLFHPALREDKMCSPSDFAQLLKAIKKLIRQHREKLKAKAQQAM